MPRRSHFARNALTPSSIVVPESLPGPGSGGALDAAGGTGPDHEPAYSHLVACASASAQVV
jgi:hypothetical protein